jgi:hypothetical protein
MNVWLFFCLLLLWVGAAVAVQNVTQNKGLYSELDEYVLYVGRDEELMPFKVGRSNGKSTSRKTIDTVVKIVAHQPNFDSSPLPTANYKYNTSDVLLAGRIRSRSIGNLRLAPAPGQQRRRRLVDNVDIPDDAAKTAADDDIPEPRMMEVSRGFLPLPCNGYKLGHVTTTPCKPWSAMHFNVSQEVLIPCGQCVTMSEFTSAGRSSAILKLPFGLSIEGKLDFPSGTTEVTVITSHVYIQGILTMKSLEMVRPVPRIRFIMTGNDDQVFIPHETNLALCGGKGFACNVGPRAVVVAGGTVDMIGMPNGCPTWVRPESEVPSTGLSASNWAGFRYRLSATAISPHWHQPGGVCYNLASVADKTKIGAWSYVRQTKLEVLTDPDGSDDETFYRLTGRQEQWHSITWNIRPECVTRGVTYTFQSRLRVHSTEPRSVLVVLKVFPWDETPSEIHQILTCPLPSSTKIGWVECLGDVTFDDKLVHAKKIELLYFVPHDSTADMDYKGISFLYKGGSPQAVQTVAQAVESCWANGNHISIPSQSLFYEEDSVLVLEQNSATEGLGFGRTESENDGGEVPKKLFTTSEFSSTPQEQAAEIMLLQRNIVFETEPGAPKSRAGHFMVLNTQEAEQRLEGVAFIGFGQEGMRGRYPINLHMCGNLPGSRFDRNLILRSNNRCIVLDGTSNVEVSRNVAFDTVGHCYALEDGGEMNNVFEYNIGARTRAAEKFDAGERDNNPATFLISNPQNTYRGNVAAGSADSGFIFLFQKSVIGDSGNFQVDVIPQSLKFKVFDDNVAHSNTVAGFKMAMVAPFERSTLKGLKAFRNRNYGIYTFTIENVNFEDAFISDNQCGIDLNLSDDIGVTNSRIVGYSPAFREYTNLIQHPKNNFCRQGGLRQVGLDFFSVLSNKMSRGPTISNTSFHNFGIQNGCPDGLGLKVGGEVANVVFDATTKLSGLKWDRSTGPGEKFSLCPALEKDVSQIVLEDDGGLNPSGTNTPGYVASADAAESLRDHVQCVPAGEGTCALYCTGSCLRTVSFLLSPHDTEGATISLRDNANTANVKTLTGSLQPTEGHDAHFWKRRRLFRALLPPGNFTAIILSPMGQPIWPKAVDVTYGTPPTCGGGPFLENVTIFRPAVQAQECEQLVIDPGFDGGATTLAQWYHSGVSLQIETFAGTGNNALFTAAARQAFVDGPVFFLDTRCFSDSSVLEISADFILQNSQGQQVECNPYDYMSPVRCPTVSLVATKNQDVDFWFDIAFARDAWNRDQFNTISGIFIVDEKVVAADSLVLLFSRVKKDVRIALDNVSVKVHQNMCGNIVQNGEFHSKDHWYDMASTISLSDGSLLVDGRNFWYSGVAQRLNTLCLKAGQSYVVSAKLKLLAGTSAVTCDPGRLYVSDQSCPNINLRIKTGKGEEFLEVGRSVGPYKGGQDDWNSIYGVVTITEDMMQASELLLYLNRAGEGVKMVLDEITMVPAKKGTFGLRDCKQLLRNPEATQGNAAFWLTTGIGSHIVTAPAAQSTRGQVFNYMGRTKWFHSMFQDIDKTCLLPNTHWILEASILLVDANTNSMHICDTSCKTVECAESESGGMCPWFQLTFENPGVKDTVSLFTENPATWQNTGFNKVFARYTAKSAVQDYDSVYVGIIGPRAGTNIIVDSFTVKSDEEGKIVT